MRKNIISRIKNLEDKLHENPPVTFYLIREFMGKWYFWNFDNWNSNKYVRYQLITENEAMKLQAEAEAKEIEVVFERLDNIAPLPKRYLNYNPGMRNAFFFAARDLFTPKKSLIKEEKDYREL